MREAPAVAALRTQVGFGPCAAPPSQPRHCGLRWAAGLTALLLPTALLAWLTHHRLNIEVHESTQALFNTGQAPIRSEPKDAENAGFWDATACNDACSTAFVSAYHGLAQAINFVHDQSPRSRAHSDSMIDADGSFFPNLFDPSDSNIAGLEQRSLAGSDDALAAFLTVAAHLPDYRERSQRLLLLNAARGSVLALITMSERALVGFGFEAPDRAASVFFEYLAWATGRWNTDADSDAFRPSIARLYSPIECEGAVAFARRVAVQHRAFLERDQVARGLTCVDREWTPH